MGTLAFNSYVRSLLWPEAPSRGFGSVLFGVFFLVALVQRMRYANARQPRGAGKVAGGTPI